MIKVVLERGREKSLLRRHPWVFSGAVDGRASGAPDGAEPPIADVFSSDGAWLGRGLYSAASQMRVRMLTFERGEEVGADFFRRRIAAAWRRRARVWDPAERNAARWVHGESDGLPGLVADRYANVVSLQILCAGMEFFRDEIAAAFIDAAPELEALYERSDTAARALEGLPPRRGAIAGALPRAPLAVAAHGLRWTVDVENGHKTGCYLDQVDNWAAAGALARGRDVLDAFCYGGGFAAHCLAGGAKSVLAVDSSADALRAAAENLALNGLGGARCELMGKDVFTALRGLRDRAASFDMVILDPPKFADSKARAERACRAYKDINMLAFKLLRPGGLLATFSCSGAVGPDLFQKVVADAALDAGRDARVTARWFQAPDHPAPLSFPEGLYLKGLLCET